MIRFLPSFGIRDHLCSLTLFRFAHAASQAAAVDDAVGTASAERAAAAGFHPDIISSDLHIGKRGVKTKPNTDTCFQ